MHGLTLRIDGYTEIQPLQNKIQHPRNQAVVYFRCQAPKLNSFGLAHQAPVIEADKSRLDTDRRRPSLHGSERLSGHGPSCSLSDRDQAT